MTEKAIMWKVINENERSVQPDKENTLRYTRDTNRLLIHNGTAYEQINPNPRGEYSDTEVYQRFDLVGYSGAQWLALGSSVGQTPEEGDYWTLFADHGPPGPPGPPGPTTTTTASFTQPSSGANVAILVGDTTIFGDAETVYIVGGGYYSVASKASSTNMTITNLGVSGNASPGATIANSATVTAAGPQGPQGSPATNLVTSVFTRDGAVVATSGDYTASQITNTPTGNLSATTVQAALNELDSEKQAVAAKNQGNGYPGLASSPGTMDSTTVLYGDGIYRVLTSSSYDHLSPLVNAENSITTGTTLTSSAFAKLHVLTGSADYAVTLPSASGNTGKLIEFRVPTSVSTARVFTLSRAGTDTGPFGSNTFGLVSGDSLLLECTGSGWHALTKKLVSPRESMTPYQSASDVSNGTITLVTGSWTTMVGPFTFILLSSTSQVHFIVGGSSTVLNGSVPFGSYSEIFVDSATEAYVGGGFANANYVNPMGGAQPIIFPAASGSGLNYPQLAAGSHTFSVRGRANTNTCSWYCRSSTYPWEAVYARVLEYR